MFFLGCEFVAEGVGVGWNFGGVALHFDFGGVALRRDCNC